MNPAEIIERAHKAYCAPTSAIPYELHADEDDRERMKAVVLATLDAIREPSEEVLGAMWKADEAAGPKRATYAELYRAGIDALKRKVAG